LLETSFPLSSYPTATHAAWTIGCATILRSRWSATTTTITASLATVFQWIWADELNLIATLDAAIIVGMAIIATALVSTVMLGLVTVVAGYAIESYRRRHHDIGSAK
jgi:hypothetical protein